MTTDILIVELARYRTRLASKEECLRSELERVHTQIEAAELILQRHEWEDGGTAPEVETTDGAPTAPTAQDIAHCKSIMAGLREAARLGGGYIKVRPTAQLLIDSGLSEAKSTGNAAASIYQRLRNDKDWELHRSGVFRYLPFFASGVVEGQTEGEPENGSTVTLLACPDPLSETDRACPS